MQRNLECYLRRLKNKFYLVNHCFDVDGGFGDAILQEEVICGFDNREDADEFVEKYSNPHIYDSPYASLCL